MINIKLELFVTYFKNKIDNAENKFPWFEMTQWKNLELSVINNLATKINELYQVDTCYFQHIRNGFEVNQNIITSGTKSCFSNALYLSEDSQQLISNYIDIIIDQDYNYKFDKDNYEKSVLYLNKLIIPVFERLRVNNDDTSYTYMTNIDKMLDRCNIKFFRGVEMANNLSNIINSKLIQQDKGEQIVDIINLFKKINNEYDSIDKLSKNIQPEQQKKHTLNQTIIQPEQQKKHTLNQTNIQQPTPFEQAKNFGEIRNKLNNLDDLKVPGLKSLCKECKLDTNKCEKRIDYINILENYKKKEIQNLKKK